MTVLNVAVTLVFDVMLNVHVVFVPVHAPDHPANVEFVPACAVSVTVEL